MTISLTDHGGSQEPTTPTRIGAGSFATVFDSPGRAIVTKVAHEVDHAAQVEWEFTSLQAVLAAIQNDPDMLFMLPRPLAFYNPRSQRLLFSSQSTNFPPGPGMAIRRLSNAPLGAPPFTPDFFSNLPQRPCYVMDRAAPLPPYAANRIREHFYPPRATGSGGVQVHVPAPVICRLYFGKELRPSTFVNPVNFPLDVARYDVLRDRGDDIPSKDEVAEGMGEMLAAIHWKAGFDARDVEFVLSGAPYSGGLRYYVIDFNQMRTFDKVDGDVSELVDAFFANDPYYPRPIPCDALYETFKKGYLGACPSENQERAALFLEAIQRHHAETHAT